MNNTLRKKNLYNNLLCSHRFENSIYITRFTCTKSGTKADTPSLLANTRPRTFCIDSDIRTQKFIRTIGKKNSRDQWNNQKKCTPL